MVKAIVIDLLGFGTKRLFSVFLAIFMILSGVFGKADALGIRETVETSDGIVQRIRFTKEEFPAVIDFFKAEKDRLEKYWPTFWAYSSPVVIGLTYLLPAGLGILSFLERIFMGHNEVTDLIFKSHIAGGLFDLGVAVIFSLLFAYDGIPRASRISARWDYWNVRQIIELIDDALNKAPLEHELKDSRVINGFYIDETPQGEVRVGITYENGTFRYLHVRFKSMGNEGDFKGLYYNKFWKKILKNQV